MILFVGKKAKQRTETFADRERAIEADYFARRCGLTRDEALKIIKDARPDKPIVTLVRAKPQ